MAENGNNLKPFKCDACGRLIGRRWANVLFAFGVVFPFRRTQDVVCQCGQPTKFVVDRQDEKVYKLRVES